MSSSFNRIKKNIIEAMQSTSNQGTSAYDSVAEVRRVEGDTAWVHIAGGVDETPVKLTVAAKAGDTVQVRVGGGRAWITGNATAPPTDDTTALIAKGTAQTANQKAGEAKQSAKQAGEKAESAMVEAGEAKEKVLRVEKDLDSITLTDDVTGEITVNGSSIELNSIPAEAIDDAFTSEVEANAEDVKNLKTGMSEVRNSIKIDNGDAYSGIDPSITLMVKDAYSDATLNGVRIEPSEMVFIVDNAERAKVAPQGLESDSVIVNNITLDPFVWAVRESEHLSLKRRR